MVRAEIIAIGSELLLGGVADTNSLYLAEELLRLGIEVRYKTVVGDDHKDIEAALQHALGRADVVITTGGLGPTEDDLTRKVVARVTGRRLVLHDETLQRITQRIAARRRRMTAQQATQALIPRGAKVIPNPVGTAPGFFLHFKDEQKAERALLCLPGVAMEVTHIFPEGGSALLEAFVGTASRGTLLRRRLRTFGLVESELDACLKDLYTAERNVVLGLQAGAYGVDVSITVQGRYPDSAEAVMRRMERAVRDRVGDYLYATGNQTMEGVVALKLQAKGLTVAVAESCTGGLIGQRLTSVPGSSAYFERGDVTYSDRAKVDLLKVPEALIRAKGAVSGEVAQAMAEGVREQSGADLGLAVTGIAGPTGGTKEKPVGLVYLALADKKTAVVRSHLFSGDRDGIRCRASQAALDLLRRYLSGKEIE
ncbi:MAG TPA: competence/damage-inducible protein A [Nitrospirales bacterium]|nr:competence/damage-inducible protein A [Nitrospirales bacterium]